MDVFPSIFHAMNTFNTSLRTRDVAVIVEIMHELAYLMFGILNLHVMVELLCWHNILHQSLFCLTVKKNI